MPDPVVEATSAGGMSSVGTPLLWGAFTLLVLAMLALDLGVFHRKAHAVGVREALGWSVFWIVLSLVFNLGIYFWWHGERDPSDVALEFLTGYLIEKALSVDNIFVFLVIFEYFAVPTAYRHRVLFYGILGAMILRAIFILLGAALLAAFHWMMYVFGAVLVYTGVKLFLQKGTEVHPERNPLFRLFARVVPAVSEYRGPRFLVRDLGRWVATPLLLVLVAIEATDVVFAVDSIPAIFAITLDPFIVYTSNICAILGLRALFFLLAGVMEGLHYLRAGLAMVLVFVGIKMLAADFYKDKVSDRVAIVVSLAVVTLLIAGAVVASLVRQRLVPSAPPDPPKD